MSNERLRTTIRESGYTEQSLANELALDSKSVQRWITRDITPRRASAYRAAKLLNVSPAWLWPNMEAKREIASQSEQVSLYPHRADAPRHLWMDLLSGASKNVWLFANASLFLPEENPDSIALIRKKAESGVMVRILMGDPDSPEMALRGVEEQLYDAIPARIRMALTYYSSLIGISGISFRLHRTSLYNSIFRYDNDMLVNQHIFGAYGYIAPLLHLRRIEGGDFFDTYVRSFERVWDISQPVEESNFWKQRVALLSGDARDPASSPP